MDSTTAIPGLSPEKNSWLNTSAAASEYNWKSMNSSAVPSHPATAARTRAAMLRWAAGGRSAASGSGVWVVIVLPRGCGVVGFLQLEKHFGRGGCVAGQREGV